MEEPEVRITLSKLFFNFRLKVRQKSHSQWPLFMVLRGLVGEASWKRRMALVGARFPSQLMTDWALPALWKACFLWTCKSVCRHNTGAHPLCYLLCRESCVYSFPSPSLATWKDLFPLPVVGLWRTSKERWISLAGQLGLGRLPHASQMLRAH